MEEGKNSSKHSAVHTCEINMKLPSLNDYVKVCRANKYYAAAEKKQIEEQIAWFICKLPRFRNPVNVHFLWIEKDMKRDADNLTFAKKFILDALVKAGKLKDDSRRYVKGFTDTIRTGKETKVIIFIEELKNENQSE